MTPSWLIWAECAFVSLWLLIGDSTCHRPTRYRCPVSWHHEGIRPSGDVMCAPNPIGDPMMDGTFGHPDTSVQPPGRVHARIYCTSGTSPIVVDDRAVGCQR